MKSGWRSPAFIFALIVLWRVVLLIFTAQPIPANDAFFFDGPVVNYLLHGHYYNPALSEAFPISGHQLYSAYPPLYQGVLFLWMSFFGASVISAIALHLALFSVAGWLVLMIIKRYFPGDSNIVLVSLFFLVITFQDRPEDVVHVLGISMLLILSSHLTAPVRWHRLLLVTLLLLASLYTSVIAAALYFGAGFIMVAIHWSKHRQTWLLVPFFAAAALFVLITCGIARFEPLWWQGFLENSRQTPLRTTGIRLPQAGEIIKLVRNAPVFWVGLLAVPCVWWRRKAIFSEGTTWPFILAGVFLMGWVLLVADMTILASNYVMYVSYLQVIVAAGLLALAGTCFPAYRRCLNLVLLASVLLVSIRAVGMTTWGGLCAWKNGYHQTHETLRIELQPFSTNDAPVILSSAYLYSALEFGVQHPVHSDWYYNRASSDPEADIKAMEQLRPTKLILAQFDYYRAFVPLLKRLQAHSGSVEVHVRDQALCRTPDSIPSLQRVVQHISWAPVIVDLEWKN